jgi:hypothetical protein
MKRVSHIQVASLLRYDPSTGRMFWRVARGRVAAGQPAGTLIVRQTRSFYRVKIMGSVYSMHHIAWLLMTKQWPPKLVGFRNGNARDLRWRNLIDLSQSLKTLHAASTSLAGRLPKGVYVSPSGAWVARVGFAGRGFYLGQHASERQAETVRRNVELLIDLVAKAHHTSGRRLSR